MFLPNFFAKTPSILRAPADEGTGTTETEDTTETTTETETTSEESTTETEETTSLLGDEEETETVSEEPITIEALTFPESLELPEDVQETFLETLNDPTLSKTELVQKLIDMQGDAISGVAEAQATQWNDLQEQWRNETKDLAKIGGENLPATLADIKKGLKAAGATTEVFKMFDLTGAGNNPHMVGVLHTLTKPFLEKAVVSGDPVTEPTTRAQRMFGAKKET